METQTVTEANKTAGTDNQGLKKYPIAEIFTSIQGEGSFSGTQMTFVRFAGCSVGKKIPDPIKSNLGLPVYAEQCCTHDGRIFTCDTDFRTKEVLTVEEILDRVSPGIVHLCLTGGEPLIHDLDALVHECLHRRMLVHIETSGTIPIPHVVLNMYTRASFWVTVSPKQGARDAAILAADEVKLLVDEHFNETHVPESILQHRLIWIQPINGEHEISRENLQRCMVLLTKHPSWRLSLQIHKYLKVR